MSPHESGIKVVDLEGDVRNGLDEFVERAVLVESHPLHSVRACAEAGNVQAKLFKRRLSGARDAGWNADVVVAPSKFGDCRWGFVIEAALLRQVVRRRP